MTPLRLEAPAKLNLSLAVTGRRADGYHELASVFVLLELADRLLLMPGCSGLRIEAPPDEEIPAGPANLAWRGLRVGMGEEPQLACLTVEKQIAVAAGMGGGSSDAAAAWRLGRRWVGAPERLAAGEIEALSAIGADVPFFAAAVAAAYVTGIGERVEALPPEPAVVVLVHPPFALSTAAVFAELRPTDWSGTSPPHAAEPGVNDLLGPARRLRPEIDDLRRLVLAAGGEPHLTGSGPTLFVISDDDERASSVSSRLERAGLRTTLTRTRGEAASIEAIAEEAT